MTVNHFSAQASIQSSNKQQSNAVFQAQETLYAFLLNAVKAWSAEEVLQEFKRIFIQPTESVSADIIPALYQIIFANQEQEFRNTLKRSCYILVNNWEIARAYQPIQELIQLFSDPSLDKPTGSRTLRRLRQWLKNFANSSDFEELKLFAQRYDNHGAIHWHYRYVPYLLVSQYTNLNNPFEQRQAAQNLYLKLKEKFKFELAMYTAHSERVSPINKQLSNPTCLGDDVLFLIKKVVARRGSFNYPNLARIFLKQVELSTYKAFKKSLLEYLLFSVEHGEVSEILKQQLAKKLNLLYLEHQERTLDSSLILRSANRVIDYLTIEPNQEPSQIFVLLLSKGGSLTLVILLLKIILICQYSRTHLETRIAGLIRYYEKHSEEECRWLIHFLEVFKITMAIYAENVEYNLVKMNYCYSNALSQPLDRVRIFSQLKPDRLQGNSKLAKLPEGEPIAEGVETA
ncbi:MAG: hypothetical protein Kow00121_25570 [Elainellaceae cyanobacterium]